MSISLSTATHISKTHGQVATSNLASDVNPKEFSSEQFDLSIVVPVYNEVENIPRLVDCIVEVLENEVDTYEIICVDDGSTDGSTKVLQQLTTIYPQLRAILLRRNYGQTAAMAAGFEHAQGQIIVTLDGDLQNDPRDIPLLLARMNDGYDLVSGWRKQRQDAALTRLLPSKIANWLIAKVTGVFLHDYGCSLKAYRAELVSDLKLYGELHRFLPALAFIEGARITEMPVRHHPRRHGQSKYGLGRTFRVMMDLLTVYFMKTFLTRPMHVFGVLGMTSLSAGIVIGFYLVFTKFIMNQAIGDRPLLMLAVVLFLSGIQLFCFGLLGELMMRTYHESQNKPIYRIRERVGF